jgi:hypothetical protein
MVTFFPFLSSFLALVSADPNLLARSPAGGQEAFTPALQPSSRLQSDLAGGITPRDIFGRQTCDTGKYCSSILLLPSFPSAQLNHLLIISHRFRLLLSHDYYLLLQIMYSGFRGMLL